MKALIIGYGISGKAAAQFLKAEGHTVLCVDKSGKADLLDTDLFSLKGFDLAVISPGISSAHPLVQRVEQQGIEMISEIELGLRHLKNKTLFAITGSNGKTTTALLTEHILCEAEKKAIALGNIGKGFSEFLLLPSQAEIVILELSSFQLERIETKAFDAAIVLNIVPNHLDRHPSMQAYAQAKANIQKGLKEEGELFISEQVQKDFGDHFFKAKIFEKEIAHLNELRYTQLEMPSKQSIQAAYLLCRRCGVTDTDFLRSLQTFKKPPHRIEWVAEINGVAYYNDSKSSNPSSVIHAVERFEKSMILIVGGVHKGASYSSWIEPFQNKVRSIIAYGKAAPIIEYELRAHFPIQVVGPFIEAVKCAKKEAKSGEIVLLSPGCSSYDQFENFEQRGDTFKSLVREV